MPSDYDRYSVKDYGICLDSKHNCGRWYKIYILVRHQNSRDTDRKLKHINFFFQSGGLGVPEFNWDKKKANVYLPLFEYQKYVDLLNSEEPVRVKVYNSAKRIVLETGLEEPVGGM